MRLFFRLGNDEKFFPYNLRIIVCSLKAISAHERFHKNALFLYSGGNLNTETRSMF